MDLVLMSKVTGNLITATFKREWVLVSWGGVDHNMSYQSFVSGILLNKRIYTNLGTL